MTEDGSSRRELFDDIPARLVALEASVRSKERMRRGAKPEGGGLIGIWLWGAGTHKEPATRRTEGAAGGAAPSDDRRDRRRTTVRRLLL